MKLTLPDRTNGKQVLGGNFGRLAAVFRNNAPQAEEIRKIARDISNTVPTDDFPSAMRRLLAISYGIDQTKKSVLGTKADTGLSNSICQLVTYFYVSSMDVEPVHLIQANDIYEITKSGNEADRWFAPKAFNIKMALSGVLDAKNFASELELPGAEKTYENLRKQISGFDDVNRRIIEALHELRKYGVKNSWFQDNVMHDQGKAWLMVNPFEAVTSHHSPILRNLLASVVLVDKREVNKAKVTQERIDFSDIAGIIPVSVGIPGYVSFGITRSGELDVIGGFDAIPYRKIFQGMDKEYEYELLRMASILRLWDLVVPLEISNKAPRLPSTTTFREKIATLIQPKKQLFDPRLIVPRVRLLETPGIANALELEMEIGIDTAEKRARAEMRKHDVIGHVRKLHQGYKASVDARMRAAEEGITLHDGETYVVTHKRGKAPGDDRIHKAVKH